MPYQNDINAQLSDLGYVTHLVHQDAACTPFRKTLILACGATPQPLTGTTAETELLGLPIPAGILGAAGWVRLQLLGTCTNNANTKTIAARLGGLAGYKFWENQYTASTKFAALAGFFNRSAVSQVAMTTDFGGGFSAGTSGLFLGAIDTRQAQTLSITGRLGSAADTITLEGFILELMPS